jgi:transcriptional regulator with PAS, ATPase and Fis domain
VLVTWRGRTSLFAVRDGQTIVIGRSPDCDVFLDDGQISRRHAAIHALPSGLEVEDLGSHNGTTLLGTSPPSDDTETWRSNHKLTPHIRTPLVDDALIQVGTALVTIQTPRNLEHQPGASGFVIVDQAMVRVLELASRVARTSLTVILRGESGAGKDMLARYLHEQSPRREHRMICLNCGALPDTLLESELFGHEKGAFTDAVAAKPGLLEAADGGTVFLDEIGELPLSLQVKLLRVLEDRKVLRVGALEPRTVDVRFLAATNRDLEQLVTEGKFREDLFYRLNGIMLHMPPLRDRHDDIVPLAERFVAELGATLDRPTPRLSSAAVDKLVAYHWPGNVRQLKNVIHRALVICDGPDILASDIVLPEGDSRPPAPARDDPDELRQLAEDAERRRILETLEECGGNQTRAAERLGITRRVLVRKLDKHKLPRPRRDAND